MLDIVVPDEVRANWQARTDGIVRYGAPVLRAKAQPVGRPGRETRELVDRMKATMLASNGIGLAAPQVGVLLRVIVYRGAEDDAPIRSLINPRIVSAKGEQTGEEGCLSIPLLHGEVTRPNAIIVKALDLLGRPVTVRADELESRVIQHEIDHLDGILYIDRANPSTLEWSEPADPDAKPEQEP